MVARKVRVPRGARPLEGRPPLPMPAKRRLSLAWQKVVRAGAVVAVLWEE